VLTTDAASLNFKGSDVSLTKDGDEITVDVSGGSNVGSLSDLSDVSSATQSDGSVLASDGTSYSEESVQSLFDSHVSVSASDVSGVSPDSDPNAHHAVFEPADYTPVSDVEAHGNALAIDITGNADAVDGKDASAFFQQQSDRILQFPDDSSPSGRFRIVKLSSSPVLQIDHTSAFGSDYIQLDASSKTAATDVNWGFGGEPNPSYAVETAGDMRATGEVEAFLGSDRRLKMALDPLGSALDKVDQLTGYGFDWREGDAVQPHKRGETDVGLIAQEVEGVLPEAVQEFQDGHSEGYKSVSYDKLVPLLVEAIKDLRSQIEQVQ